MAANEKDAQSKPAESTPASTLTTSADVGDTAKPAAPSLPVAADVASNADDKKSEKDPSVEMEQKPPTPTKAPGHKTHAPPKGHGWEFVGEMIGKMFSLLFKNLGVWTGAHMATSQLRAEIEKPVKDLEATIKKCDNEIERQELWLQGLKNTENNLRMAVINAAGKDNGAAEKSYKEFIDGKPPKQLSYEDRKKYHEDKQKEAQVERDKAADTLAKVKPHYERQKEVIANIEKDLRGQMSGDWTAKEVASRRKDFDKELNHLKQQVKNVLEGPAPELPAVNVRRTAVAEDPTEEALVTAAHLQQQQEDQLVHAKDELADLKKQTPPKPGDPTNVVQYEAHVKEDQKRQHDAEAKYRAEEATRQEQEAAARAQHKDAPRMNPNS